MVLTRAARLRASRITRHRSRRTGSIPKINDVVDIWWAVDETFHRGRLTNRLHNNTSFRIHYDEGLEKDIDLDSERWKFAQDDKILPDVDEIVLEGSHQPSRESEMESDPQKTKQESSKPRATHLKRRHTGENDSIKESTEELCAQMHASIQKHSNPDSEKPTKRVKSRRQQAESSGKTSTASYRHTRTVSASGQVVDPRPNQHGSNSHPALAATKQAQAVESMKNHDSSLPEPQNMAETLPCTEKNEAKSKRSKSSRIIRIAKTASPPEQRNALLQVPNNDAAPQGLVNRKLSIIEKKLCALANDMHQLTNEAVYRPDTNDSLMTLFTRLERTVRSDVSSVHEELRSVHAAESARQENMIISLRQLKAEVAFISRHLVEYSVPAPQARGIVSDGSNLELLRYNRNCIAPRRTVNARHASEQRAPMQHSRFPTRSPGSFDVEGFEIDSGRNRTLPSSRVEAPTSHDLRDPATITLNNALQLPLCARNRITKLVAQHVTLWLLSTSHEHNPDSNLSVDEWARITSARAFGRVANCLLRFEEYTQALQVRLEKFENVETSWFTNPRNIHQARRNYAVWNPPLTNAEWDLEAILLAEISHAFHRELEAHVWEKEDILSAAIAITEKASASYGLRLNNSSRRFLRRNRVSR